ncbi:NADH-quinone oxidoreductase subunit A [Mycobacterium sp. OTB74]|jgi:NADH-quinone oxidoreductase subunit A|uniref:NADH-quinone oxidoreductase subunit A n=1 Tax=Mycobacterium sp. OTB74 TaxID=1853452 RepID=UPI002476E2C2|nr:NADH-quinone oxidoreductase subunit A [Mycobacterium sp. OTB74]MDH6242625.1 NADH-quinone oxidoreductase subunit A [Mycobacterium sp. OTB74]
MNVYVPILVLGAIAAVFAIGSVGIALVIGPRRYNRAKLEAYECGIEPMEPGSLGHETTGQRFPVKYYLTAMLFIVFDIEIVFLYPWAVSFDSLGVFAVVEMLLFMLTVFVAYAYIWRRGGLNWD